MAPSCDSPIALQLENVRLEIPVFSTETRSLKASLILSLIHI